MRDVRVEVRGLREVARALKQADDGLKRALPDELKGVAGRVADRARSRVPRRTGRAASSIVPRASQRGAAIAFGGSRAEYYPWLDFGGRVGRNRSVVREVIPGGRYVYPAIAESRDEIVEGVEAAVVKVTRHAGFEVR